LDVVILPLRPLKQKSLAQMIEIRVIGNQVWEIFSKKTSKNLPGYQKGFYLCGPKRSKQTTKESSEV